MGYKEDVLIMNFLEKHGIRPYTKIKDIPSYSYFKELLADFLKESNNYTFWVCERVILCYLREQQTY